MSDRAPWFCPACGRAHPGGQRCPKAVDRRRAYDRTRGARHYGTRRWQEFRRTWLLDHPFCECGAPATLVDHIVPHRGDVAIFWRQGNHQSLCAPCHNSRKRRAENAEAKQ